MPMAMWLLPVPVPPISTTLRWLSRKLPPASCSTSSSLIGVALEVEISQLLGERQLGDPHLIVDRTRLLGGDLGLEQGTNDLLDTVLALDACRDDLVVGRSHAGELQGRHHLQDLRALHDAISRVGVRSPS